MSAEQHHVDQLVSHLFRHEAGKMAAVLTRLLGFSNLETADDIVQDTLIQAMTAWKFHGVPDKPEAWLYAVARNKAIDVVRKGKRIAQHHKQINVLLQSEWTLTNTVNQFFLENEIADSQLRMIFACCHPSVPYESQIALTLKTLCGLSVQEIAHGFLTNEETISKRIYRAREKIREEKIELDEPVQNIVERVDAVLNTLYLLFNEGYNSSNPDSLIRKDLCSEAMRLCHLLTKDARTDLPETRALLALMCLQASRFDARLDSKGNIILLKHQDRAKWNQEFIQRGLHYLSIASQGEILSGYHLEAAIASCHARAQRFEETNWKEIYTLYETLAKLRPGPVVEMNKAIALGYFESPQIGLEALLRITSLDSSYLYHTAIGDFYHLLGNGKAAHEAYKRARVLSPSEVEKTLLEYKLIANLNPGKD